MNMILAPELGRRLREARERAGLTQAQAAEVIQASRTTVVAIEKGERHLRVSELVALVQAYQVDINHLLDADARQLAAKLTVERDRWQRLAGEFQWACWQAVSRQTKALGCLAATREALAALPVDRAILEPVWRALEEGLELENED